MSEQQEKPKPLVPISAPIDKQPPVQVVKSDSIEQRLGSRKGY